jgi:hypothetical protein
LLFRSMTDPLFTRISALASRLGAAYHTHFVAADAV